MYSNDGVKVSSSSSYETYNILNNTIINERCNEQYDSIINRLENEINNISNGRLSPSEIEQIKSDQQRKLQEDREIFKINPESIRYNPQRRNA